MVDVASKPDHRKWDTFISYASEDKADIAIPLAEILRSEGLYVWFDKFELRPGDSISQSIEEGLANSNVGIVILSQTSLRKNWTKYEVAALKQLYINFGKRIIPIWKDIGPDELRRTDPGLLDIRALSTKDLSTEEIAYEVISVANPRLLSRLNARSTWKAFQKTASITSVPLKDLKPGPHQRQKLSAHNLSRIRVLHSVFREILHDKLEAWIDNFRRDINYEEEILVWETTAALLLDWMSSVGSSNISKQERRQMYEVIFKLTSGFPLEDTLRSLEKLPRRHVKCFNEIAELWDQEIGVIQAYSTLELVDHPTIVQKFYSSLKGSQSNS
jgi:DNA polymerase III delta prime subunit